MFSPETLHHAMATYGLWGLAGIVALESMGLPLPGETALILAAVYAGSHEESVVAVVLAASAGAIVGDNVGYLVGRDVGYPLLLRHGWRMGVTEGRLKLGQYLFRRYGAGVVFIGRFVALLRVLAAFLAGANRLHWTTFLVANAAGAFVWASLVGGGAYWLGRNAAHGHGPLRWAMVALALFVVVTLALALKRNEARLIDQAERDDPAPLPGYRRGPEG
ncbi:MAG: DedA family protein [Rhizobiales bacterium]|nr:DedA family protein [Hyphomicrobiales bacterium]